eukprot:6809189-Heterocapsa_arctica.AAC.1
MCNYYQNPGGCHRGEACTFAHGPPGTLSPAAQAAKGGGKGKKGGKGAAAVRVAFLSVSRTRTGGPLPT